MSPLINWAEKGFSPGARPLEILPRPVSLVCVSEYFLIRPTLPNEKKQKNPSPLEHPLTHTFLNKRWEIEISATRSTY